MMVGRLPISRHVNFGYLIPGPYPHRRAAKSSVIIRPFLAQRTEQYIENAIAHGILPEVTGLRGAAVLVAGLLNSASARRFAPLSPC